jgi:hypothetical protein
MQMPGNSSFNQWSMYLDAIFSVSTKTFIFQQIGVAVFA